MCKRCVIFYLADSFLREGSSAAKLQTDIAALVGEDAAVEIMGQISDLVAKRIRKLKTARDMGTKFKCKCQTKPWSQK